MDIKPNFNPATGTFELTVESYYVSKYFNNLSGMFKDTEKIFPGLTIMKTSTGGALFSIPIMNTNSKKEDLGNGTVKFSIPLDMTKFDKLNKTFDRFLKAAYRKELKLTEFVPLTGYSIDNLSNEIVDAVKNKRDILFIKDYKEYLNAEKEGASRIFHQYRVAYGSVEYVDCVLMIKNKQITKLKKLYSDKLEVADWTI